LILAAVTERDRGEASAIFVAKVGDDGERLDAIGRARL
jgi:hypothetical protein